MDRRRDPDARPHRPALPRAGRVARLQLRLLGWYDVYGRDLPWRRTRDPYAILVSEVMLQQTQVVRVVPRYHAFLIRFPTLEALAAAPLREVLEEWSGLGYNNRAERLLRCARTIVAASPATRPAGPTIAARGPAAAHGPTAGGRDSAAAEDPAAGGPATLPECLDELRSLPGVGPYTARAILIFAHNADLAAVDANVRRVLTHELGLPHDLSPSALQQVAESVLPRGRSRDWHNALMDYGAQVLTGRATGIAPRSRQGRFAGSRRWYRSQVVRLLVAEGPLPVATVAAAVHLDEPALRDLLADLVRDRIVTYERDLLRVS